MKTSSRIAILLLVLVALLAAPTTVFAQDGGDGKVIFGGTYRLNSGETLNGALAIFGGEATLEENSRVNGDVALSGGTLTVRGEINGDIAVLGGAVFLEDTARVTGDINTLGGKVNRSPGADVEGNITNGPNNFSLPIPSRGYRPNFTINFDPIGKVLWAGFESIVLAAIAV
ncbi:MAG TPA: polymer-forming cytoskeletal protein, partial [Anaerolineaceae bacterium]|nr:polymer-forming cytoskeletal protein [Anaerolineaceae bacterium]